MIGAAELLSRRRADSDRLILMLKLLVPPTALAVFERELRQTLKVSQASALTEAINIAKTNSSKKTEEEQRALFIKIVEAAE